MYGRERKIRTVSWSDLTKEEVVNEVEFLL